LPNGVYFLQSQLHSQSQLPLPYNVRYFDSLGRHAVTSTSCKQTLTFHASNANEDEVYTRKIFASFLLSRRGWLQKQPFFLASIVGLFLDRIGVDIEHNVFGLPRLAGLSLWLASTEE
jgi:hypothetical protein